MICKTLVEMKFFPRTSVAPSPFPNQAKKSACCSSYLHSTLFHPGLPCREVGFPRNWPPSPSATCSVFPSPRSSKLTGAKSWVTSLQSQISLPEDEFPEVDLIPLAFRKASRPPPALQTPRAPSPAQPGPTSWEASGAQPRLFFPPRAGLKPNWCVPRPISPSRLATSTEATPRSPPPGLTPRPPAAALTPSPSPRLRRPRPPPRPQQSGARPAPPPAAQPWRVPERPRAAARPSPFTCSIARSGTPLNRLRRLRVPNRTRRLLEPTRSCRDPQIPPLPRRLTGRFPLGGFLWFPPIGLKSSPSSLLLSHWTVGRVLPPPRFETGRCSESPTHHVLYDWREGRTSATPIGHLARQSWPRWPRPLVLFFLEISTSPIGLTDSVTAPPSDLKNFNWSSFPASGSLPTSQLFTSGGQSIGASASPSVLPVSIQG
ncbi:proline-rich protein 36-like isoform X1 [Bos taurus]|uniref:proline-rich protein 36-like isoform X1 n=1 Tax=Bos taurus TaxID=9913 RepID=UPI0028CB2F70|nr:proline-rich protein 36-like isoform X1 [Bos taurus]